MTKIVVTGDTFIENNMLRIPDVHLSFSQLVPSRLQVPRDSGTHFLCELTGKICSCMAEKPDIEIHAWDKSGENAKKNIPEAFSIWSPFIKINGSEKKEMVWRMEQFLGCQKLEPEITENNSY